jgi:phage I-like protein
LLSAAIAIAACSYLLAVGDSNLATVQLTPAGKFLPSDGRPMSVPGWNIDMAVATKVISRFRARKTPLVIDYEHQTLHKEANGQPAPAAAWIKDLEWRDGAGLFATVELTSKARQAIQDGEYKYFSPVFRFDARTGDVLEIEMGAITNTPAIHGMDALALRAAACFGLTNEEPEVNKNLLSCVITLLALASSTTEADAVAALTARLQEDPLDPLRQALGCDAKSDQATLVAACTAMKTGQVKPDPSKFVPIATLTALQTEMASLSARLALRDQNDLEVQLQEALADGRLLPAMEPWARDLGKTNVAALTSYLAAAAPIAALTKTQTNGQSPIVDEPNGLSAEELAVCTNMNIAPADYAKSKKV